MPSGNLELARSIFTAWERGEYGSNEWAHPDIEFVVADGPTQGTSHGLDGMAEAWRAWLSVWRDFRQVADGYRELDGERVLVLFQASGRGKTSGVELAEIGQGGAGVFHFRGGKVVRFDAYLDRRNVPAV